MEGAVWLFPQERDRRLDEGAVLLRVIDALVGLRVFEAQRIGPAADQEQVRLELGVLAGLDPGINERLAEVVHPEAGGVLGADDELIFARSLGEKGPVPANREVARRDL